MAEWATLLTIMLKGSIWSVVLMRVLMLFGRYLRESFVPRLAPVSREMILNFVGQKVLGCELFWHFQDDLPWTEAFSIVPKSY